MNTVGDPKVDPDAAANAAADISEATPDRTGARRHRRARSPGEDRRRGALARDVRRGAAIPGRPRVPRRRRRASDAAEWRLRRQHRHPRRAQSRLEARAGAQGRRRRRSCSTTYEAERKPVGKFTVEQAYTRYVTRTATYLGAKDFQPPAQRFQHRARLSLQFAGDRAGGRPTAKDHDDPRPDARPARLARAACLARARRQEDLDPRPVRHALRAAGRSARRTRGATRRARLRRHVQGPRARRLLRRRAICAIRTIASPPAYGLSPIGRGAGAAGWLRRLACQVARRQTPRPRSIDALRTILAR